MAKKKSSRAKPEETSLEHQLEACLLKLKPYYLPALAVLLLGLGSVAVWGWVDNSRRVRIAKAYELLAEAYALDSDLARADDDATREEILDKRETLLKAVADEYEGTPAALEATLQLARLDFDRGYYRQAGEKFARFAAENPKREPLAGLAKLGEAECELAAGDRQQAYESFTALHKAYADANPPTQLAAQAQYQAAVCALLLGKTDDARVHLEDLQVGDAASEVLKGEAEALLKRLDIVSPAMLRGGDAAPEEKKAPEAKAPEAAPGEPAAVETPTAPATSSDAAAPPAAPTPKPAAQ